MWCELKVKCAREKTRVRCVGVQLHLCTMLPASEVCRKRLDHSLSLPTENWTCFIEANPHVHCVHTIIYVQLDHCSISNVSDVRILFIQHNNVSSSDDLFALK